jgi:hypothetical protein
MIYVPITLNEIASLNEKLIPLSVSIPFENGKVFNTATLALVTQNEQLIQRQISILAYWPNKSLKWIRIDFLYTLTNNKVIDKTDTIFLTEIKNKTELTKHATKPLYTHTIEVKETSKSYNISTGAANFELHKKELGVFLSESIETVTPHFKTQNNSLVLTDKKGVSYYPFIDDISFDFPINIKEERLKITAKIAGTFQSDQIKSAIKYTAEVSFYASEAYTKWRVTLHNPHCIVHNGGTWDLGNENSLHFTSFNARIPCKKTTKLAYKISPNQEFIYPDITEEDKEKNTLLIFQASSGGSQWQSKNHVNDQGLVTFEFNGYKIASQENEQITKGRAEPTIFIEKSNDSASNISVFIKDFWQKFPKSIAIDDTSVDLGLFSQHALGGFELQPGERKSDTFYISYDNEKSSLDHFESPVQVSISPEYIASTNAVPFFTALNDENDYNDIINDGIDSENNFFQKRELIDEFGWRNFGDLYADHETLETDCDDELISHYNNQYDPLYGFLKQYLLTNNSKWLLLANDLADHVKNIDTYHTTKDKAEYNGGLFWHTDHYLPAETAGHRTYSTQQKKDAYEDHAGGGGPGGQHCYTNGLMLHYFLSGDETSKEAVLQLTQWITHVYEGSGTLTDFLLAIKNKNRIDLKNIITGKYPLDRGTGHYIIALIDSFEVTGSQSYLDKASLIIKNTVHPKDNVEAKNLSNVEECWFYTIFFQAVYRYLHVKLNIEQLDESFHYARKSLLNYADWMCEHEQPYLHRPEILEYPNHTWAAQDIRKANVLFMASYFSSDDISKTRYQIKADSIYCYVTETFNKEPTRDFTRILSILMQNHGIKSYVDNTPNVYYQQKQHLYFEHSLETNNKEHKHKINTPLFNAFWATLSNTSPSNELAWLRKRSRKVDSFFTKSGK